MEISACLWVYNLKLLIVPYYQSVVALGAKTLDMSNIQSIDSSSLASSDLSLYFWTDLCNVSQGEGMAV
jgi:hypothetical protein